jgi:hypothetical protein
MLPIATTAHVGGVKIQQGGALSVAPDGTLSEQMRFGVFYTGLISDYSEGSGTITRWLVLHDGALGNSAPNIATLKVAPAGTAGVVFDVSVDDASAGTITFKQGQTSGTFNLKATNLKAGSLIAISGDADAWAQETKAAGLVLIVVC